MFQVIIIALVLSGFLKKLDEEAEKENKWWSAAYEEDEIDLLSFTRRKGKTCSYSIAG